MQKLTKHGVSEADHWHVVSKEEVLPTDQSNESKYLIHVSKYASEHLGNKSIGIWLDSDDDVQSMGKNTLEVPVIAINFPVFTDGRGFSLAQQLRSELEFTGELRAIGHFMEEQLFHLKRCGFDSFIVEDSADTTALKKILCDFTNNYQGSSENPKPLYKRRS